MTVRKGQERWEGRREGTRGGVEKGDIMTSVRGKGEQHKREERREQNKGGGEETAPMVEVERTKQGRRREKKTVGEGERRTQGGGGEQHKRATQGMAEGETTQGGRNEEQHRGRGVDAHSNERHAGNVGQCTRCPITESHAAAKNTATQIATGTP